MIFRKFNIQGYRAVKDTDVEFSRNQLIPIIGINESGKTSILQSILAFDKSKDKTNRGYHLDYKNKYEIGKEDCFIRAFVQIESKNEIEQMLAPLKLSHQEIETLRKDLEDRLETRQPFLVARDLKTQTYSLDDIDIDSTNEKRLIRVVLQLLPFILYFDDFSDRVPEEIEFSPDYSGEQSITGRSAIAEWQKLIEEIVKRSTNGKYSLIDLFKMASEEDDQQALLEDIKDVLNDEIIEEWKELKKKGLSFADDELDLELKLDLTTWDNGSHSFKFKVVDRSTKRKRQFNVVERSKGFQWFFNFTLKLKFNTKYKTNPSGAIYLLDEPGSYLHASAQDELLKALKDISKTNVILYCTHSQHLLNPQVINVSSIRIAEKKSASIRIVPFAEYGGNSNVGALTPLYDALRMRLPLNLLDKDRVLITEGIIDYYFFELLTKHRKDWELDAVCIIPGAGAGNLRDLISLVISQTDLFYVVFDRDSAGISAAAKYEEYFGEEVARHFVFYGDPDDSKFLLEDYLSAEDRKRIKEITGAKNVKAGIVTLYFMDKSKQEEFVRELSSSCVAKLEGIFGKLLKLDASGNRNQIVA